jgi:hypothetical protein
MRCLADALVPSAIVVTNAIAIKQTLGFFVIFQSSHWSGSVLESAVKDVLIRAVEAGTPLKTIIARMVYTNPLVVIDDNATVEEKRRNKIKEPSDYSKNQIRTGAKFNFLDKQKLNWN